MSNNNIMNQHSLDAEKESGRGSFDKRGYFEFVLQNMDEPKVWHEEPVFCFTIDIDFASEYVLDALFNDLPLSELKLTIFVTHHSEVVEEKYRLKTLDRGIHPNFLSGSSHGNGFNEIIDHCISLAPEAESYRSHRLFEVTDTAHNLFENKGFKYASNATSILNDRLKPLLHESGIINFPIFFEDGTHLYNELDKGLKFINFITSLSHCKESSSCKSDSSTGLNNNLSVSSNLMSILLIIY